MKPSFWQRVAIGSCLGLLLANPVTVMASDDLDVTMRMVLDNEELTESVVREIELSEPVRHVKKRAGQPGLRPSVPGKSANRTGSVGAPRNPNGRSRQIALNAPIFPDSGLNRL